MKKCLTSIIQLDIVNPQLHTIRQVHIHNFVHSILISLNRSSDHCGLNQMRQDQRYVSVGQDGSYRQETVCHSKKRRPDVLNVMDRQGQGIDLMKMVSLRLR